MSVIYNFAVPESFIPFSVNHFRIRFVLNKRICTMKTESLHILVDLMQNKNLVPVFRKNTKKKCCNVVSLESIGLKKKIM